MADIKYYALYPYMEDKLEFCRHLGRIRDNWPELYDANKDDWVPDDTVLQIFFGELSYQRITEEQAEYVKKRIQSGEAEELAYNTWKNSKRYKELHKDKS